MFTCRDYSAPKITQKDCRRLQRKLEVANAEEFDVLFEYLIESFAERAVDQFGNYLCQKLYEYANVTKRTKLLLLIEEKVVEIACNCYGTRVIQKIVQASTDKSLCLYLEKILSPHAFCFCTDQHACHIIQKCLALWSPNDCEFIFKAVLGNCEPVCCNRWGCCIYQRCIDRSGTSCKMLLAAAVCQKANALICDPFGNYALQYVIDLEVGYFVDAVTEKLLENHNDMITYACHKFGSNVVEKCIRMAKRENRTRLIEAIVENSSSLLNDSFGNYVLQTALDFAESGQRQSLVKIVELRLPLIEHTPHGKKLYSKIYREIRLPKSQILR